MGGRGLRRGWVSCAVGEWPASHRKPGASIIESARAEDVCCVFTRTFFLSFLLFLALVAGLVLFLFARGSDTAFIVQSLNVHVDFIVLQRLVACVHEVFLADMVPPIILSLHLEECIACRIIASLAREPYQPGVFAPDLSHHDNPDGAHCLHILVTAQVLDELIHRRDAVLQVREEAVQISAPHDGDQRLLALDGSVDQLLVFQEKLLEFELRVHCALYLGTGVLQCRLNDRAERLAIFGVLVHLSECMRVE